MKVIAVKEYYYGSQTYLAGEEFEHEEGADLNAMLALGKLKKAEVSEPEYKDEGT